MSQTPRKRKKKTISQEPPELNLMAFMSLMTLLIPFLLVSIQFVTLAVIDSSLPAIGQPKPSDDKDKDDTPPLNLTVGITDEGYTVAGSAAVLGCDKSAGSGEDNCTTIPLTDDARYCGDTICRGNPKCIPNQVTPCHDIRALHELLVQLKGVDADGDGDADYDEPCNPPDPRPEGWSAPEVCNVIIAPNPDILYQTIVGVMDASRDYTKDGESDLSPLFPYVVVAGGVK
jgi:hypothetical protein